MENPKPGELLGKWNELYDRWSLLIVIIGVDEAGCIWVISANNGTRYRIPLDSLEGYENYGMAGKRINLPSV